MPAAINKNGIASPAEKIVSKSAPLSALVDVDAKSKIEPSIGPTHGVQPKAKAEPKIKEFRVLSLSKIAKVLHGLPPRKKVGLKMSSIKSPKIITKTPPILPNHQR